MAGYGKMMQQMAKMQRDMEKKQAELDATEFVGTAGGSAVEITVNGKREVLNLSIMDELVDVEEKEELIDMLKIAINDALNKVEVETDKAMSKFSGGANIPGLF
ncbi:YbaB/EbfC family nucleoid-associated protein [Culicoidibacter larvae]|uniref:Nucleoid-associated protein FEZ08_00855 n=1 Tax=Culicoidibacter larvae TaxID=2579976 RepID=A0A5R8QGT2_9FIRM|nr:YbaB/EbfC family nucleoid-associated protein [Culicoidibacter larvae]TLG77198.1 YbaB/EbfC family nucleoid-associated protein [Culicoidibacter larvae]